MNENGKRARNAMVGLAIGDAMSWNAMFHRSHLLPAWTRRKRREMDHASEDANVVTIPMPFSLNQPADRFDVAPTDDTEWAAFTATLLLRKDTAFENSLLEGWLGLARSGAVIKGGVSTQAALRNLRNDILPPRSGRENPHFFDDGAVARAVPIGMFCVGMPEKAAEMAGRDALFTNAEDGVWAAQAMAIAISLACAGSSSEECLAAAIGSLPADSLIRRKMDMALELADGGRSLFAILPELQKVVVNREYSYGNAAPETLPLAFVIAKLLGKDFASAVTAAAAIPKTADSLPAMVGALVGSFSSGEIAGTGWIAAITTLKGVCIPSLKGKNFLDITDQLCAASMNDNRPK